MSALATLIALAPTTGGSRVRDILGGNSQVPRSLPPAVRSGLRPVPSHTATARSCATSSWGPRGRTCTAAPPCSTSASCPPTRSRRPSRCVCACTFVCACTYACRRHHVRARCNHRCCTRSALTRAAPRARVASALMRCGCAAPRTCAVEVPGCLCWVGVIGLLFPRAQVIIATPLEGAGIRLDPTFAGAAEIGKRPFQTTHVTILRGRANPGAPVAAAVAAALPSNGS
jgi:hypothetical protein